MDKEIIAKMAQPDEGDAHASMECGEERGKQELEDWTVLDIFFRFPMRQNLIWLFTKITPEQMGTWCLASGFKYFDFPFLFFSRECPN
jgi:hypothetical protein